MIKNTPDIWAIQKDKSELKTAVSNINPFVTDCIVFRNIISFFKVGEKAYVRRNFDTVLYSKDADILLMLMRGSEATSEELLKLLNERSIPYNEVTFEPLLDDRGLDDIDGDFWFAKTRSVVSDALKDSTEKNCEKTATYNPGITSYLALGHCTNGNEFSTEFVLNFKGTIKLGQSIVLITCTKDTPDISPEEILSEFDEQDYAYQVNLSEPLEETEPIIEANGLLL